LLDRNTRWLRLADALAALALILAAGAVTAGPRPDGVSPEAAAVRDAVVLNALTVLENPYDYGGDRPGGFDCSGLVHYAYQEAGLEVPRTTDGQYRAVNDAGFGELLPGDLVFFRIGGEVDHVGIYVGERRMVHAPSRGEEIRVERIDKRYWKQRYAGATDTFLEAR